MLLRVVEALGLANSCGGYIVFGASVHGATPAFHGISPGLASIFESEFRQQLRRFNLPLGAVSCHIQSGLALAEVLVVKVEKLSTPLAVVMNGAPTVARMTSDGLEFIPLEGCANMTHDAAVLVRSSLRRDVEAARTGAPPPVTPRERTLPKAPPPSLPAKTPAARVGAARRPTPAPVSRPVSPPPPADLPLTLLNWEVLPPAAVESRWMSALREALPLATGTEIREHFERLRFLRSLQPLNWFEGRRLGERVYFVLVFDQIVLADSPQHGNALYYYQGSNWRLVFSLSKQDARREGARRLVHTGDWESRARRLVRRL